jgi:hypothetical protein
MYFIWLKQIDEFKFIEFTTLVVNGSIEMFENIKNVPRIVSHISYEKENQLDATQWFIELMIRSTCFGHYYAHHQELETIQMITASGT